ncbi:hypothetical protein B6S59_03780 [Pseudomonas sp. A46]|nr:hypothetical protein B6S59_03780 [Pseudomonas sp. A46]
MILFVIKRISWSGRQTDRQLGKFITAGERIWLAEYSSDFAGFGVPGLKATVTYLRGEALSEMTL